MRKLIQQLTFVTLTIFLFSAPLFADVKLHVLFSNHMVLQRDIKIPVWGTALTGETVTVTLNEQSKNSVADDQGIWRVAFDPMKAGGPFTMQVKSNNTLLVEDILIGEVWICSGQSNMSWPLLRTTNAKRTIAQSNNSQLRLFKVKNTIADAPATATQGQWKVSQPSSAKPFSAVAFHFGSLLQAELKVAVGLIHCSWGGTTVEAWMDIQTLQTDKDYEAIFKRYSNKVFQIAPAGKPAYQKTLAKWKATIEKQSSDQTLPDRPLPAITGKLKGEAWLRPAGLYNGMVAPIIPYAFRGVIWYQGESNATRAYQYRKLFPTMIQCWRTEWGQGDFPFLFVQLANFNFSKTNLHTRDFAELREAQTMTLNLPNTAMAVTIDIGESNNIHPKNKLDVGKRLMYAALAKVYDRDLVYSGPIYKDMKVDGDSIMIQLDHTGSGMTVKGDALTGFEIAAEDQTFYPASATLKDNVIYVSSPQVKQPVAVRYGWTNDPKCNLYNKESLPASPFRTDTWQCDTFNSR